MAYVTVTEVKNWSQINYKDLGFTSEADYNSFLEGVIELVEGLIRDYCGRTWDTVPSAIKFVILEVCANILHLILQRKITPAVHANQMQLRVVFAEALTADLRVILDWHRALYVSLEEREEEV